MNRLIDRKVLISMIFTVITVLGFISYNMLPVELIPNSESEVLYVQVSVTSEVEPSVMESQAIVPLEGVVSMLEGVEEITSTINSRSATILIEFRPGADLKFAYLKLEELVNELGSTIPEEFVCRVNKANTDQMSNQFMELQVIGEGESDRIRNVIEENLLPYLEVVDGLASVKLYGGQEKSVELTLDRKACEHYALTPAAIRTALSSNYESRSYVGDVVSGSEKMFAHISSDYDNIEEVKDIIVSETGNVRLRDVADIYFGVKEETSISRINGKEAVTMILTNDSQANIIDLSHEIRAVLDKYQSDLDQYGVEVLIQSDTAEDMENNIDSIIELALTGAIFALFVLWIFLRKIRLISIIALAIPISVYAAFNFFYYFDISINTLSLVGIVLAVGMLIDNSVVVLENIYRLKGKGVESRSAVIGGTKEVWRSIFAATLTTVAVFIPFLFSDNVMVKLIGREIGISIISTLMISLLVALLLIPMLTYGILTRGSNGDKADFYKRLSTDNPLVQGYVTLLKSSMRKPLQTVIGGVILFFVVLLGTLALSVSTMATIDSDSFKVYVTMNSGSTLDKADNLVASIEDVILSIEDNGIEKVTSRIEETDCVLTIQMEEEFSEKYGNSLLTVQKLITKKTKNFGSNAEISVGVAPVSSSSYGGGGGRSKTGGDAMMRMFGVGDNSERIVLRGSNYDELKNVASDLEYYLGDMESISSARVNFPSDQPELHMFFDEILMQDYGITRRNISTELASFSDEINSNVPFKANGEEYDIMIKYALEDDEEEDESKDLTYSELKNFEIVDSNNNPQLLQNITRFRFSSGISRITRVNQEKEVQVTYSFPDEAEDSKDILTQYRAEVDDLVAGYNLPEGVAIQIVHEEDDNSDFYFIIGAALLLIFMILASVFESFVTPFVLMLSIPLAGIGSLLGLMFSGNGLENMNAMMGFLILIGIVVNNGIILIDYSNVLVKRGMSRSRSLITSGLSRIRPILITATTTVVAMFPLAMGDSEYVGAIGAPFAITVIGGLVVSTILTLVFVPTMFFGVDNAVRWVREQSLFVRISMAVVFATASAMIYFNVDSVIWQSVDLILLVVLVPGIAWFMLNSLKSASEQLIPEDEPITISIQNLVKVYGRPNRLVREFRGNKHLRRLRGIHKEYHSIKDFADYIWKVPLLVFLCYFTYGYLENMFWILLAQPVIFSFIVSLWNPIRSIINNDKVKTVVDWILRWIAPLVLAILYKNAADAGASFVFLIIFWYLTLYIIKTSKWLYANNINTERLTGRFKKLRRFVYRTIKKIPIIGNRSEPFKALQGVSMEIKSGMFGLLGPNGAGKSTMMRVITGVYEQSYGKIWINGIDTQEKREELQGLIGYLPQEFGVYDSMTAYEFLDYQAMLKNISEPGLRAERVEYVLNSVRLWDRKDDKIGGFSGGMRQRIGIAQILLHLPRILVVDEPTAGLDPRERIRFRNLLVELSKERIVIFSTHVIEDISSSCNQVVVINRGQLKYYGHPNDMTELAKGLVWQYTIPADQFESMEGKDRVVHHMKFDDKIKIRYISETKPHPDAVQVEAVLEEAYLVVLKNMKAKDV